MPRKTYVVKKRRYRRRKRTYMNRPRRFFSNLVFKGSMSSSKLFKESFVTSVAVSHLTGDYGQYVAPAVSSISQWSSYSTLFEQYKVKSVSVTFIPHVQVPTNITLGSTQPLNSTTYLAFDPNDNTTPSSTATMLSYKTLKLKQTLKYWKIKFYPQVFKNFDDTAYGTQSSKKDWVDIGNSALVLHGLKIYMADTGYRHASLDCPIGDFVTTIEFWCRSEH